MAEEKDKHQDDYDWNILGDRRKVPDRRTEERRVTSDRRTGEDRRDGDDRRIAPRRDGDTLKTTPVEKTVKMELPSSTDYISLVRQFVGGIAQKAGFTEIDIEKIELALDEACSNVLQHAYKFESNNRYAIEISVKNAKLDIVITDQGDSFTFEEAVVPDIEQHVSELKVGGLGIFIMQQMMDDVKYEPSNNGNILRMAKYIKNKSQ